LPLQYGMSLEHTAPAIGLSQGWTCRLRAQFIAGEAGGDHGTSVRGGRRRAHFTPEREAELLNPFLASARIGACWGSARSSPNSKWRWGGELALSSVYQLLHRHNWRKRAPDTRHPQSDPVAQENWGKNSPTRAPKSAKTGPTANRSG